MLSRMKTDHVSGTTCWCRSLFVECTAEAVVPEDPYEMLDPSPYEQNQKEVQWYAQEEFQWFRDLERDMHLTQILGHAPNADINQNSDKKPLVRYMAVQFKQKVKCLSSRRPKNKHDCTN